MTKVLLDTECFQHIARFILTVVSSFIYLLNRYQNAERRDSNGLFYCLTTFWTQLAYHFNRRTAGPLGASPPPGCDEPTSRCQTASSLWTLGGDQPVIPGVAFIR